MSNRRTQIVTLVLGAIVVLPLAMGSDRNHRPPAGARAAIELITSKPGRKFGRASVGRFDAIASISATSRDDVPARPALL